MKKIICMILVMCMLLGTVSGCGKSKTSGDSKTLTIGMPSSVTVEDYNTNGLTVYIEKELGIDLEFVIYGSGSDAVNQLVLECAGNEELPDVLWGFTALSTNKMNELGEGGYILDLTELIDKYADTFKMQMENLTKEEQDRIWQTGTDQNNDCFYGMPLYSAVDVGDYLQNMMTINQTWLDAVGMSAPTTTEELYQVLKAFKTQDPNGNGEDDEIAMLSTNIWLYVMNAFVYYDKENPLNVTDGQIWSPVITNEFREGIKFLNRLYKEDLLDDLTFTASSAEIKTMVSGEGTEAEVGVWCGHPSLVTNTYCEILDQYKALEPLSAATDKGGYGVRWPNDLYYCGFITKDCEEEKLETAMKFLDFLYTDEAVTRARFGVKDADWEFSDEAGTSVDGSESYIKVLNPNASSSGNTQWGVVGPKIYTPSNYLAIAPEGTDRAGAANRLVKEHTSIMKTMKQPNETTTGIIFNKEQQERLDEIESSIGSYTTECVSLFVTGSMNINSDSDWQSYLDTLEEYSLSEQIKIYQQAYDSMK